MLRKDRAERRVFGSVERCGYPTGLLGCPTCDGPGPHRAATCGRTGERVIRSRTRQAPLILMLLTALFVAASLASVRSAAADPSISAKQAEAQSVLAQIQEIDGQLSFAIEAYNLANVKLDRIKGELRTNSHHLTVARTSLKTRTGASVGRASSRSTRAAAAAARSRCILGGQVDRRPAQPDRRRRSRLRAGRARAQGGQELPRPGQARASAGSSAPRRLRFRSSPTRRRSAARSRASSPSASDCSPRSRIRSPASGRRAAPPGTPGSRGAGALPRHARTSPLKPRLRP